jgi:predicted nuclease of predicted toxin-antitoxin system
MTFLLDHDVPETVARTLLRAGYEAGRLRAGLPVEASDAEVLCYAQEHGHVLITCNRDDFLALAKRQPHTGIVILIRRCTRVAEAAELIKLLRTAGSAGVLGNMNFA